jgi:hypothetical protein
MFIQSFVAEIRIETRAFVLFQAADRPRGFRSETPITVWRLLQRTH